jgi:copper(I)-binding protein
MTAIVLFISLIDLISPQIKIENAWMRIGGKGTNSALYFDIKNTSSKDDELTDVFSDIAKVVQIHETYKQGDNLGMRKVESIKIKGNSTFQLSPGGVHVMVIRLKEDLRPGDKKEFTLTFKHSGKLKIKATVKSD